MRGSKLSRFWIATQAQAEVQHLGVCAAVLPVVPGSTMGGFGPFVSQKLVDSITHADQLAAVCAQQWVLSSENMHMNMRLLRDSSVVGQVLSFEFVYAKNLRMPPFATTVAVMTKFSWRLEIVACAGELEFE